MVRNRLRAVGKTIQEIHIDNAPEFNMLIQWCKDNGIEVRRTIPGESAQNGLAERMIGILTNNTRTLMCSCNAPKSMWAEAMSYVCYVYSHTARKQINWAIPASLLFGEPIRLELFQVWGCRCYVKEKKANKLAAQGYAGIFVGTSVINGRKGYRVWVPSKSRVEEQWNVEFISDEFPWKKIDNKKEENGGVNDYDDNINNDGNSSGLSILPSVVPSLPPASLPSLADAAPLILWLWHLLT